MTFGRLLAVLLVAGAAAATALPAAGRATVAAPGPGGAEAGVSTGVVMSDAARLSDGQGLGDGPGVSVFPIPGSRLATRQTQISFRGVAPRSLGPITVGGSHSGIHAGRLLADSDGRGASFYPNKPFSAGEVVTVHTTLPIIDALNGTFQFTVQRPAARIVPVSHDVAERVRGDVDSFRSRPDLEPAAVRIRRGHAGVADVFLTPMRGPLQWGPMIVDRWGHLVWFRSVGGPTTTVANFEEQHYRGQPVLTWWQGFISGYGSGEDVILDRHYRRIATVRAGNGLDTDLHEFSITPQGTALITSYDAVHWNGASVHRAGNIVVLNCTVQEIDILTGNVLFQWDSLDHVPLQASYAAVPSPTGGSYDYFHINSVQEGADGSLIISARNTWAVYDVDHTTGSVIWTLGGKASSFTMSDGTRTAYQHDASLHPGGLMTIFDDGDWPQVHEQSRVLLERVDTTTHTATVVRVLDHTPSVLSGHEGSAQLLANGDVFVGWGDAPYFSEYDQNGTQIFDGRFVGPISSYRSYEFRWRGEPDTRPSVAVRRGPKGSGTVFVSWNGATDVSRWRVLAGARKRSLKPITLARRRGFETSIRIRTGARWIEVRALGSSGRKLGLSRAVAWRRS